MNSSKNNKRGGNWNQYAPNCTEEEVGRLMLENIIELLKKQDSDIAPVPAPVIQRQQQQGLTLQRSPSPSSSVQEISDVSEIEDKKALKAGKQLKILSDRKNVYQPIIDKLVEHYPSFKIIRAPKSGYVSFQSFVPDARFYFVVIPTLEEEEFVKNKIAEAQAAAVEAKAAAESKAAAEAKAAAESKSAAEVKAAAEAKAAAEVKAAAEALQKQKRSQYEKIYPGWKLKWSPGLNDFVFSRADYKNDAYIMEKEVVEYNANAEAKAKASAEAKAAAEAKSAAEAKAAAEAEAAAKASLRQSPAPSQPPPPSAQPPALSPQQEQQIDNLITTFTQSIALPQDYQALQNLKSTLKKIDSNALASVNITDFSARLQVLKSGLFTQSQ